MKKFSSKYLLFFAPLIFVVYVLAVVIVFKEKTDQKESIASTQDSVQSEDDHGSELPQSEETLPVSSDSKGSDGEPDWRLVLVNFRNPMEGDPEIEFTKLSYGVTVDKRMYPDLQRMMDDARAEGLLPIVCSGFRSEEDQKALYNSHVESNIAKGMSREEAEAESVGWVAYPGTSEHQTGLAVDIVSLNNQRLDSSQENTPEQRWLMENCWKYGFILRYPNGKSRITGINYEPWHYRYVGKDAAAEMYARGITLEEYLGETYAYTEKLQD